MNAWDINPNSNGHTSLLRLLRQVWQARKARREPKVKTRPCQGGCRA